MINHFALCIFEPGFFFHSWTIWIGGRILFIMWTENLLHDRGANNASHHLYLNRGESFVYHVNGKSATWTMRHMICLSADCQMYKGIFCDSHTKSFWNPTTYWNLINTSYFSPRELLWYSWIVDTISHPTNLNRLIPVFTNTKFPEWECQDAGISVIGGSMRRNNLECDKTSEEQYVICSSNDWCVWSVHLNVH